VAVAINLVNFVASRAHWPTLPAFPILIDSYPKVSLLILVALVAVGLVVQIMMRNRPKESTARMISYTLTVGVALAAIFEALDLAWGALRSA